MNTGTAYVEQDPVTGQATMLHTSSDIAALYVYDGTGSPVGLLTDFSTSSFQCKYDPYGLAVLQQSSGGNGVGQNPYAFKSGVQDRATGFVKFGQRWYNPATGTWTQQDTHDKPLDLGNANRYAYAGGDPVNNADPSGSLTTGDIKLLSEALGYFLDGEDLGKVLTADELSQINDVLIGVAVGVICEAIPGFNEVTLGFGCIAVGELAESVAEQVNP